MRDSLESYVLQAAISARRRLNDDVGDVKRDACYRLLLSCELLARAYGWRDLDFIRSMVRTYADGKRDFVHDSPADVWDW